MAIGEILYQTHVWVGVLWIGRATILGARYVLFAKHRLHSLVTAFTRQGAGAHPQRQHNQNTGRLHRLCLQDTEYTEVYGHSGEW